MGLFSGFNQLSSIASSVKSAQSTFSGLKSNATAAFGGISGLKGAVGNFASNPSLSGLKGLASQGQDLFNLTKGITDDFNALKGTFTRGFGTRSRMGAAGGPPPGANPVAANAAQAQIISQSVSAGGIDPESNDWRVSLSVPQAIESSSLFSPFKGSGGRLVFPFTPTILFGNTASYSQIHPTHVNYPYNAYGNSQVDAITITGEFYSESSADAKYWIAVLHYLRTMTKMFYGDGAHSGNPPLVARLNGYGRHVLNNVPVVVSNFTTDLPAEVDYIAVDIDNQPNYVPVQSTMTVTLLPQYSRTTQSKFSLTKFANGKYATEGTEGFI